MIMVRELQILLFIFGSVSCRFFTDEANARLPRLFQLDDYERCLSQKDGLFCLGVFELSPKHPSPLYKHIKEYSSHPFAFNRSRLHRGYCVSERCPSTERNATVRFERCVSERAHRHALTARLHTLHHCTSHVQHTATPSHSHTYNQLTFIQIVAALLALNVLGTVYDVATRDDQKKIGILTAWSIRASWRRLTAIHEGGDPRLKDLEIIHGSRMVFMLLTLFAHASVFHYQFYITNPQFLEDWPTHPDGVMLTNGTSIVQVFLMISSFLTGYALLMYSETNKLSLAMLPVLIIKRAARTAPVHILVIWFMSTWWPRIFTGPFYSFAVEQSEICNRKFWSHVFFVNNMVDKHDQCLIPSWFLPVDMHLYILACILVIVMQHQRQQARRLFGLAFVISSIACGVVCYVTGWQAMVYFAVPELCSNLGDPKLQNTEWPHNINIRGIFANVASYGEFYTSSWASLPACFLGLYMAYLYYDLRESKYDFNKHKLLKLLHNLSVPLLTLYVIHLGTFARTNRQPLAAAAYIVVDRPGLILGIMLFILGLFKINGFWRWVSNKPFWRIPARLSLSVMMCHWLINTYIVARPYAYRTSVFDVSMDYAATVVLSHLVAVPMSVLVEIPAQRFISQFI